MTTTRFASLVERIDIKAGKNGASLPLLSVSQTLGVLRFSDLHDRPPRADLFDVYKVVEPGDIAFNKMSIRSGAVGVVPERGIVTYHYEVMRPRAGVDARFVVALMKSSWFIGELIRNERGIGAGGAAGVRTTEVPFSVMRTIRIPQLAVEEQRKIADYLDRETAEIDEFIAELRHFTNLTEERRAATRSRLFSPTYAENLLPIKRVARLVGGSGFPPDQQGIAHEELPFFKVGSLSSAEDGRLSTAPDSISRVTARSLGARVLPPGSVVMAKIGAALFLRRNALLAKPGCIDNNMLGLVPTSQTDSSYLRQVLLTLDLAPIANPGAVPSLNMQWFRETKIEAPPLEVQREVVSRFSKLDLAARLALADAAKAMELAQERRSALISTAVTGQIDVNAQGVSAVEQLRDKLEVHV